VSRPGRETGVGRQTPRPGGENIKRGVDEQAVVSEVYRTVAGRGRAGFVVRGSEFVGHVGPARSVAAAERFVASVREEYADATHNVPVYRVRADPLREYADDDGEPGGSAGDPALNVLVQEDIQNVVAVVTRYYGGTNLGVGGLARAYARGAKEALDAAAVVERHPRTRFTVGVAYDDSGTVRGILESTGVEFDAEYAATVTFEVSVPERRAEDVRDRIRSATGGRARFDS
jgi:uncharacterized YigZ family protein